VLKVHSYCHSHCHSLSLPLSLSLSLPLSPALQRHSKWVTSLAWEPVHLVYPCARSFHHFPLCRSLSLSLSLPVQGHSKWITSQPGSRRTWRTPAPGWRAAAATGTSECGSTVRRCTLFALTGHTLAVTCVKWGQRGHILWVCFISCPGLPFDCPLTLGQFLVPPLPLTAVYRQLPKKKKLRKISGFLFFLFLLVTAGLRSGECRSRDCTIKMWDSNTGRQLRQLKVLYTSEVPVSLWSYATALFLRY